MQIKVLQLRLPRGDLRTISAWHFAMCMHMYSVTVTGDTDRYRK